MTSAILDTMTSRDLMNSKVQSLSPGQSVRKAADWLERRGFSGAPVVDSNGTLVGVLSEFDCLETIAKVLDGGLPTETVEDCMTREVETVTPHTKASEVLAKFAEMSWRRLIVIDERRRVVGLIARRDLIRALKPVAYHPSYATTYEKLAALWR